MNQLTRYVTPELVEKAVGLPAGSIDSFGFLLMQELAKGVSAAQVAKELQVEEANLDELADSITGDTKGLAGDLWKACVVTIRSISLANHQAIGRGWDALEAMAVDRLARVIQDSGVGLTVKDAVAIASLANKAVRRQAGEGGARGISIHTPPGQGADMAFEVNGGHLGSIRMSLSTRVQAQLEQPKVINGETKSQDDRRMLTIEEIRSVGGK